MITTTSLCFSFPRACGLPPTQPPEDVYPIHHTKGTCMCRYYKHPLTFFASVWTMSSLLFLNCSNLSIFLARHR